MTRRTPAADCEGAQDRLAISVAEAALSIGIGKTKLWTMIREGRFPTVREGRWVRVPVQAMRDWVRRNTA